ncbi:AMP-binding protein [Streptomyces sp. NPDC004596]
MKDPYKSVMNQATRVGPGDRQILAGPVTHASGMPLMGTFFSGGRAGVLPRWDAAEFLATVESERATHAFLVPTMVIGGPDGCGDRTSGGPVAASVVEAPGHAGRVRRTATAAGLPRSGDQQGKVPL